VLGGAPRVTHFLPMGGDPFESNAKLQRKIEAQFHHRSQYCYTLHDSQTLLL
jgi:hypothetical protein